MGNNKNHKRDVLNSIRLTLLDWDPMDLFAIGQAGLEEYDEYISDIAKHIRKSKNPDELKEYLQKLVMEEMDVSSFDEDKTRQAAEKLYSLNLD